MDVPNVLDRGIMVWSMSPLHISTAHTAAFVFAGGMCTVGPVTITHIHTTSLALLFGLWSFIVMCTVLGSCCLVNTCYRCCDCRECETSGIPSP